MENSKNRYSHNLHRRGCGPIVTAFNITMLTDHDYLLIRNNYFPLSFRWDGALQKV